VARIIFLIFKNTPTFLFKKLNAKATKDSAKRLKTGVTLRGLLRNYPIRAANAS